MIIYIVLLNSGKTMPLSVEKSEKICEVKRRIGVPVERQILTFNHQTLDDDELTVQDYNIPSKSEVFLEIDENFNLNVRINPGENIISVNVEGSDTVEDLKSQLEEPVGMRGFRMRLFFAGEILGKGSLTLYDLNNVCNGATMDLLPILVGSRTVFVDSLNGFVYPFKIERGDTIKAIQDKFILDDEEDDIIPIERQRYFYMGQRLYEHISLFKYNVQPNATIRLVEEPSVTDYAEIDVYDVHTQETYSLEVIPAVTTVKDLKEQIEEGTNIPPHHQTLFPPPLQQLKNPSLTLSEYDIHHNTTVHMVFSSMKIFVKAQDEYVFTVAVEGKDTIAQVKSKIEDQEEIPHEHQILMFFGECLKDDLTLESYGIQWGFNLTLEEI